MPKSKDVLLGQAEALEEFARLYDVAEKEADAYEQYPPDAVDYARRRAAELRAQATALPDVPAQEFGDLTGVQVCCGEYGKCHRPCTPRGRYLANLDHELAAKQAVQDAALSHAIQAIRARHK